MLIDFVPTVGGVSLSESPAFKKAPGGAPANVAVGISRLGGSSAFIGKVPLKFSTLCSSIFYPCIINIPNKIKVPIHFLPIVMANTTVF